jgi:hypothetical protein
MATRLRGATNKKMIDDKVPDRDLVKDRRERILVGSTRTTARATVWMAVCSVATIVLTISTFLILRGQLVVMERQLEVMRADQRPHMIISPDNDGPTRYSDGLVYWNFNIENIGKSPALQNRMSLLFKVGKTVTKRAEGALPGWGTRPAEKSFSTAFADSKFSAAEFASLKSQDRGFILLVELKYSDAFGGKYEDAFCFSTAPNGTMPILEPATCRSN